MWFGVDFGLGAVSLCSVRSVLVAMPFAPSNLVAI